jgi:hypothetical protein
MLEFTVLCLENPCVGINLHPKLLSRTYRGPLVKVAVTPIKPCTRKR